MREARYEPFFMFHRQNTNKTSYHACLYARSWNTHAHTRIRCKCFTTPNCTVMQIVIGNCARTLLSLCIFVTLVRVMLLLPSHFFCGKFILIWDFVVQKEFFSMKMRKKWKRKKYDIHRHCRWKLYFHRKFFTVTEITKIITANAKWKISM